MVVGGESNQWQSLDNYIGVQATLCGEPSPCSEASKDTDIKQWTGVKQFGRRNACSKESHRHQHIKVQYLPSSGMLA